MFTITGNVLDNPDKPVNDTITDVIWFNDVIDNDFENFSGVSIAPIAAGVMVVFDAAVNLPFASTVNVPD